MQLCEVCNQVWYKIGIPTGLPAGHPERVCSTPCLRKARYRARLEAGEAREAAAAMELDEVEQALVRGEQPSPWRRYPNPRKEEV